MKLPDGPKTPPLIQELCWIADPIDYMEAAAKRYGDIFTARVGEHGGKSVYVSNPQVIKQILSNDTKQLTAPGRLNEVLKPLVGDYSVFMLEGARHRRERQLMIPPFHGDSIQAYGKLICEITQQVMSQITPGKPFSALTAMRNISLKVILEVVFGLHEKERYKRVEQLIQSLQNFFGTPLMASVLFFPALQNNLNFWNPARSFFRQRQQLGELLYAEITERRKQLKEIDRIDILSLLMSVRDETGESMTDQELHDELLTLLFAGHDTVAVAIAWALYWIHYLPEVRKKLLTELDTLGHSPEPMSIVRLPYLTAVCQETLRIYPVALLTLPRQVQSLIEVMGYQLEPGTVVVGCIYLTHHREDLYPEPKQFKPERFLERHFYPHEYLPFGGGSRRCIGDALAPFEMKLVLATILSCYQLVLMDNRPIQPQRQGILLSPVGGVKMVMMG
jgi:cytochrome P450 family 110